MNLTGGRWSDLVPDGDGASPEPACPLVMEAVSARLDGEEASLADRPVDDHLARCGRCRAFERAARSLAVRPTTRTPAAEPGERLVASLVATPPDGAIRRSAWRLARLRRRPGGAVAWGIGVMALGLALPPVALAAAPHLHAAASGGAVPCAVLLHHLHHLPTRGR
ncbi:MAG: hypothetical protein ACYCU7_03650 [Acidimicrobiales bacterium]